MASPPYGLIKGDPVRVRFLMDATGAAIVAGDFVEEAGTAGYVKQCAAGGLPFGVAYESQALPSSDGGNAVLVEISTNCVYRYPPDAGTVTQALVGRTMDIGGAQSINIDASADDCVVCVGVDIDNNTLDIMLCEPTKRFAGVV